MALRYASADLKRSPSLQCLSATGGFTQLIHSRDACVKLYSEKSKIEIIYVWLQMQQTSHSLEVLGSGITFITSTLPVA